MTDQTPEERDRELELRQERDQLQAFADDREQDLVAILVTTDRQSRIPLLERMDTDGLRAVTLRILDWLDECRNFPEADLLFADLWIRSRVALGTTADAIAALADDTPHDEPPC